MTSGSRSNPLETHGVRGLPPQHAFDQWNPSLQMRAALHRNGIRYVPRQILHGIGSGLLRCNNPGRLLHHRKPDPMTCDICLSGPLSRISRFWLCACNNKRVRASETFAAVAFFVASIDYRHLTRSRRSVRRRGNLDPVSKGMRLMQKTLLRQREVRMMSSKGMDLLST